MQLAFKGNKLPLAYKGNKPQPAITGTKVQLAFKRGMDLVGSLVGLLVLGPLMLLIAVAVKATSPGPAIFVQERVGLNGRLFSCYKFRSMVVEAEKLKASLEHLNEMDGPVFKIKNDPRITRFGSFIRRTSMDELPQLFNVLKGDMSLVGPRPPLPCEVQRYEQVHLNRLSVKPGLTCIWQVSGRNNLDFESWMEMDTLYIRQWNIWLDIRLILQTIPAVLLRKGAF